MLLDLSIHRHTGGLEMLLFRHSEHCQIHRHTGGLEKNIIIAKI
ncbi:hypothetical protein [uncultured Gammaproteobacteria bacterium]|nr:hypothetical protein [uncultured Gammaproteobacteria bacterium]CAC9655290.1 hypothetical protein [uncultured Gammaproteobacteria bacterium]